MNHWGHLRGASHWHDRERGRLAGNEITYLIRARRESLKVGWRENSRWNHSSRLAVNSDETFISICRECRGCDDLRLGVPELCRGEPGVRENPRVGGSIPPLATILIKELGPRAAV